jgi:hypothetical protein
VRGNRRSHLLALLSAGAGALVVIPQALACGSAGYAYAGVASASRSHGVGARVTAIGAPIVKSGHVAGWVGVGGPRQGPHGTDEWIQVGFSGFQGSVLSSLYYEVTRSGAQPRYVEVERGLQPGASRRVAVLEMAKRPNWWRVWVNGRPASAPILLPGSHGVWRAIATAESWGAGSSACNGFGYRFDRIVVAQHAGGSWRALASSLPILSGGFRVLRPAASSLVAISGRLVRPTLRPVLSATNSKPKPAPATPTAAPTPAPAPAPTPSADPQVSPADDPRAPAPDEAQPSPVGGPAAP